VSQPELRPDRDQPGLALLAVAATVLVLPVLVLAGDFRGADLPGIVLAAALVAVRRDTAHATVALLIVAVLWLHSSPAAVTPWSVVMATLMLTMHSATALRSSIPPRALVGSTLARRWLRRGAVVTGLTMLVYLLSVALHQLNRGSSELVLVLTLCLVVGLVLLLRSETLRRP
jgi:hypothetical protein